MHIVFYKLSDVSSKENAIFFCQLLSLSTTKRRLVTWRARISRVEIKDVEQISEVQPHSLDLHIHLN